MRVFWGIKTLDSQLFSCILVSGTKRLHKNVVPNSHAAYPEWSGTSSKPKEGAEMTKLDNATTVIAPQLAAPEDAQGAMDKAYDDAANAAPEKPRHEHICASCGKGDLVRKDKKGKPLLDDKGNVKHDRALFLIIAPGGEPLREESGARKRYHFGCACAVRDVAPVDYRSDVEVVMAFKFDERKRERQQEWRERNRGAQAEGAEVWAGVAKTLAHGRPTATFADPNGPKNASPVAAAFAKANGDRPVEPASFGKPEKPRAKRGGKRDGKDRRHDRDDD